MRVETVECNSRETAKRRCPWAAKIAQVTDGYICFESVQDYETWRQQR